MLWISAWADERLNELNQDNDIENEFYTNSKTELAYTNYTFFKEFEGGVEYKCIPREIYDAKIWMLEYWFWPHIYNNRFQELLKERESIIHPLQVDLATAEEKLKRSRRKTIIITAVTSSVVAVLSTIGGVKLGLQLQK